MDDILGVGKALEQTVGPITDLVKTLAGPAAQEVAETLRDSVKVYRAKRQYRLFEKMQAFFHEKGVKPNPVALKVLLPALDYASVEDDEQLHTMWANLIASAALPRALGKPYPAFVDALRLLSREDAMFINALHDQVERRIEAWMELPASDNKLRQHPYNKLGSWKDMIDLYLKANNLPLETLEREGMEISAALENIARLGLIESPGVGQASYRMSAFGGMFGMLCRHPECNLGSLSEGK